MEANETTKKYDFDRVIRIVMTIVVVGVLIFVVDYLSGVLLPFLVGCLLAYILNPCEEWLRRTLHLKQRALSSVLTIVLAFSLLGGRHQFVPGVRFPSLGLLLLGEGIPRPLSELVVPFLPNVFLPVDFADDDAGGSIRVFLLRVFDLQPSLFGFVDDVHHSFGHLLSPK